MSIGEVIKEEPLSHVQAGNPTLCEQASDRFFVVLLLSAPASRASDIAPSPQVVQPCANPPTTSTREYVVHPVNSILGPSPDE
jgi:hypothetical protein